MVNDYSVFGYSSDAAFVSAIENAIEDVKLLMFYPQIGSSSYAVISALDKSGLSERQEYIYWSEVYFSCYEFVTSNDSTSNVTSTASASESLSVEGYSYSSTSDESQESGVETAARMYYEKGLHYMLLAGYNPNSIQRTCEVFGDGDSTDVDVYPEVV